MGGGGGRYGALKGIREGCGGWACAGHRVREDLGGGGGRVVGGD